MSTMFRIVTVAATLKIVPVHKQTFHQYNLWSFPSLVALVIWFLVPFSLFAFAKIRTASYTTEFPEISPTFLEDMTFSLICSDMGLILLVGPQLLGVLMKKCSSLFDFSVLPIPRKHWMIWLTAPLPTLGFLIISLDFTRDLTAYPTIPWDIATVLCVLPNTFLAVASSVVQTTILLIMSSVLTHMIVKLRELSSPIVNADNIWTVCDMYDDVCNVLAPLYLLLFSVLSINVMVMSFFLYIYIYDLLSIINSCLFLMHGTLLLFHLAFLASDCGESINDLHLHFR